MSEFVVEVSEYEHYPCFNCLQSGLPFLRLVVVVGFEQKMVLLSKMLRRSQSYTLRFRSVLPGLLRKRERRYFSTEEEKIATTSFG